MRIAVFPGTFDPITLGHVDIVQRTLTMFDKIIISIGVNANKQTMFSLEKRKAWIEDIFKSYPQVEVETYEGLTVNFCATKNARYILRGIRSVGDFEYEKAIADMNRMVNPDIETFFLACSPAYSSYSSSIVRDLIRNHGNISQFVPKQVVID
jgi:pantetheine-phosphate adenylyltransferase